MSFIFGGGSHHDDKPHAAKNPLRECRRVISRGLRDLQSESRDLTACEARDVKAVKEAVARGDQHCIRASAVQLVRTKARARKNASMQSRMVAMDRRFADMGTTTSMARSMAIATQAMKALAGPGSMAALSKVIRDFDMQNGMVDEQLSMMGEALDGMAEEEGEEIEADTAIQQVLAEIGMDSDVLLPRAAPRLRAEGKDALLATDVDNEFERRLAMLKH